MPHRARRHGLVAWSLATLAGPIAGCASGSGRSHDLPNVGLLPVAVSYLETPTQVSWAFPRPVHVVVLEAEPRRPGFRVAYQATAEQLEEWDPRAPVTIDATTSRYVDPPSPVASRPCRTVYLGAGDKDGRQVCDAPPVSSAMLGSGAYGWGFQRRLLLIVSTSFIDTLPLVASERWSRLGTRPPGVEGEWAMSPLALPRRPLSER